MNNRNLRLFIWEILFKCDEHLLDEDEKDVVFSLEKKNKVRFDGIPTELK